MNTPRRIARVRPGGEGSRAGLKRARRRQLIETAISSIAKRGFARMTVADVAKEAGMSQGIVNFYFKSKDALLLATLQYLADEYEAFWSSRVARAGGSPGAALDAITEADFHPAICCRKKVSVGYAFWGEARSRPAYLKLCAKLANDYFEKVGVWCRQIVDQGGYEGVDAEVVARGLNAMIDGFWLDLLIDPRSFDREKAKEACGAILAGVFPREFAEPTVRRRRAL